MSKKTITFIFILLMISIISIGAFVIRNKPSVKSCSSEGNTIPIPNEICCNGLKPINGQGGYQGECPGPISIGGLSICAPCGNGVCNTEHEENKCNCPEDCTGEEKPCIRDYQTVDLDNSESCCPGLKAIKIAHYEKDCSVTPSTIGASRMACFKCGDGNCDGGVYLENDCNCPEDCK
ncbi:hypothetical protein JW968_05615 [Candidatus Woesearchaeota archaeon]|nr:hypothetical protein [Candidatus Woesearchaeota archaeon]